MVHTDTIIPKKGPSACHLLGAGELTEKVLAVVFTEHVLHATVCAERFISSQGLRTAPGVGSVITPKSHV